MNAALDRKCVLVVDDEPDLCTLYELTLLREGYAVHTADRLSQARALLDQRKFDLLITDMRLPDGSGMALLEHNALAQPQAASLVITAYGSAANAVEALKAGAFDYLTKPVDLQALRQAVRAALASRSAPAPRSSARANSPSGLHAPASAWRATQGEQALARLVGDSPAMQAIKARIGKVAPSMAPVLICGESGTGKELVAQAIHANSHRADGPWVAVNCGAIPEALIEAEFFGVRKGAYTGAQADREGFFQAASGGTLFLDEIGELPLALQAKLLRAIQERRVRPLGATAEVPVDVRLISATHRPLGSEVASGRFRQDLFYRLNVIDLNLPALRERRADLPALCAALLARIAPECGLPPIALDPQWLAELQRLPLPGNVRELENLLVRAATLGEPIAAPAPGPQASRAALPQSQPAAPTPAQHVTDLPAHLDRIERELLIAALERTHYNRTAAAQQLGISLRQIRYRIERLGICAPDGPPDKPCDPPRDASC